MSFPGFGGYDTIDPFADGAIRNMDLRAGSLGAVDGEGDIDSHDRDAFRVAVYVNTQLTQLVAPNQTFSAPPTTDDLIDVELVSIPRGATNIPARFGALNPSRAFVVWSPILDDPTLAGYEVYTDGGNALLTTSNFIFAASLNIKTIEQVTGRVSPDNPLVSISVTGFPNELCPPVELSIAVDGPASEVTIENTVSSSVIATIPLQVGQFIETPLGFKIRVDSFDPDESDSVPIIAGFDNVFVSDALPNGTYRYAVRSIDTAGNTSALSTPASITIVTPLAPPINPAVAITALNNIRWTWAEPTDLRVTDVAVYSNIRLLPDDTAVVEEFVIEDQPLVTVLVEANEYIFDTTNLVLPAAFPVLSYLRNRGSLGEPEENNATLLRLRIDASPVSLLPTPRIVTGTPGPGGVIRLLVEMDISAGVPASFDIYQDGVFLQNIVANLVPIGTPQQLLVTSAQMDGLTAEYSVKALDITSRATEFSNVVTVTADDSAPDAPTITNSGAV